MYFLAINHWCVRERTTEHGVAKKKKGYYFSRRCSGWREQKEDWKNDHKYWCNIKRAIRFVLKLNCFFLNGLMPLIFSKNCTHKLVLFKLFLPTIRDFPFWWKRHFFFKSVPPYLFKTYWDLESLKDTYIYIIFLLVNNYGVSNVAPTLLGEH